MLGVVTDGVPYAYRRLVRPQLPITGPPPKYNNIKIAGSQSPTETQPHLLDSIIPWEIPREFNKPEYEGGLIDGYQQYTEQGDHVVIIGGGNGVSGVVAANNVGPGGQVTIFEGSRQQVEKSGIH